MIGVFVLGEKACKLDYQFKLGVPEPGAVAAPGRYW